MNLKLFAAFLFLCIGLGLQELRGQEFFKVKDSLYSASAFKQLYSTYREMKPNPPEGLDSLFKLVTLEHHIVERVKVNNMVINNVAVHQYLGNIQPPAVTDAQWLNQSLPNLNSFKHLLGERSVICFWSKTFEPDERLIETLNELQRKSDVNVIAILEGSCQNKNWSKEAKFPYIENTGNYIKEKLKINRDTRYYILDREGRVSFLFDFLPANNIPFWNFTTPIQDENLEIYMFIAGFYKKPTYSSITN
ncbi:hypothetical protein RM553_13905 [Zunongwangia sp. F363]|uniref:Uncharacterized protein n=1 Tax=Autumnicola tepida TaxID=3075595 RepID=A0ABU3CC61_9FLAO|nr:hypothetical protein [Zunongwangia sp. F363]MDT0643927.1 hypothetical protein [Zunongwangia sp. F363]